MTTGSLASQGVQKKPLSIARGVFLVPQPLPEM